MAGRPFLAYRNLSVSHLLLETTGAFFLSLGATTPPPTLPFWSMVTWAPLQISTPEYFITSFDRSSFDVRFYNVIYPWLIVCFYHNLKEVFSRRAWWEPLSLLHCQVLLPIWSARGDVVSILKSLMREGLANPFTTRYFNLSFRKLLDVSSLAKNNSASFLCWRHSNWGGVKPSSQRQVTWKANCMGSYLSSLGLTYMALSKFLTYPMPQFPHLYNADYIRVRLVKLLCALYELT